MITNTITDEVYIGYSEDIKRRWSCHKANMKKKANRFSYQSFSNAFQINEINIKWDILEEIPFECAEVELPKKETYWIDFIRNTGTVVVNKNNSGAVPRNSEEAKLHKSIAQTGERNGNAKLSDRKVEQMIRLYYDGETVRDLSEIFGVSVSTVKRICRYEDSRKNTVERVKNKIEYERLMNAVAS